MAGLYYSILIASLDGYEARLKLASKHLFPSPVGTYLRSLDLGHGIGLLHICGHTDSYSSGNFYMLLGLKSDGESGDDFPEITSPNAREIVQVLKSDGWEECPLA